MKKKKWFMLIVLILVFCNLILPFVEMTYAHFRGGLGPVVVAAGVGLCAGWHLSRPYTLYVPPTICYQIIPGHYEHAWDPFLYQYVPLWVPDRKVSVPCQ